MPRVRIVGTLLALLLIAGSAAGQEQAAAPKPVVSPPKISGYLQARETWQENVGLTGSINRARLTAAGTVASDFSWRLSGEFRTGNVGNGKATVALQDAYVRWAHQGFAILAGQYKTPFTREYVTGLPDLESADRSTVVDSLAPKRDIGLMGEYAFRKQATLSVGVFNGNGQNVTSNPDSSLLGVARLVVKPIPRFALGANVARYFGDSTRYGADANYEDTRLVLRGEYVAQTRDSLGGDADDGFVVLGGVKPDPRVQVYAKYEEFQRPEISPQQKNRAWTAGVNGFFEGNAVRLTLEYISRKIGDPGTRKGMLLTQVQLRF
jgi:hypothetical protein